MKIMTRLTSLAAGGALVFAGIAAPSVAMAAPNGHAVAKYSQADIKKRIKKINDSTFVFKLAAGDHLSKDKRHLINSSGQKVALPLEATDHNNHPVTIDYAERNGIVAFHITDQWSTRSWKCPVGTGSGAAAGALAGASNGLAIGSAFPGIGNAVGAIAGGVIGAIAGGGGASVASC